jgi:hypothetical protein
MTERRLLRHTTLLTHTDVTMTKKDERRRTTGRRSQDTADDALFQNLAEKFETLEQERRERIRRATDRLRGLRRTAKGDATTPKEGE